MNHKTRELAEDLYAKWRDDVICYAPPESSRIATFEESKKHFRARAVKIKKTLAYRKDKHW